MALDISTIFVKQFSTTIQYLVQQMETRIEKAVRVETGIRAEDAYFDQIGARTAQTKVSRHERVNYADQTYDRRRVSPIVKFDADLLDNDDKLRAIIDPTSPISRSIAMALNRAKDDAIIDAFFGIAYSGKTGTTANTWASFTDQIIASGSAGLTKSKILEAMQILDANEVPREDRFLVCSAKQITDLLNTTEVASADYNTVKALVQGEINTWLGFNIIRSERLAVNGSSERRVCAFQKQGMLLAYSQDITATIDRMPEYHNATQIYASMQIGATRMEEKRVVEIACTE